MPNLPTWKQIRRFCETDGWDEGRTARGAIPDHYRFTKRLPDGHILRTKAPHAPGGIQDPGTWNTIWKEQLALDCAEDFWDCLLTKSPVHRNVSQTQPAPPASQRLDYSLVRRLEAVLGMPAHEAVKLTHQEAIQLLQHHEER